MLKFLFRCALFGLTAVIVIELFFRTALPACNAALSAQEPHYKLMMFDSTKQRDGVFTVGRFATPRPAWHVNNRGWLAHNNYDPPSATRKPVIAVIGDSYVEGYHVSDKDHVANVIRDRLGGAYDVYRFGSAGAPLSHYLQTSRYLASEFDPDVFVIIVQDDDIADAVANYKRTPAFEQLRYEDGGFHETPITFKYRAHPVKRLVRKSAILRYLALNRRYTFFEEFGLRYIRAALHPGKKSKPVAKDPAILEQAAAEITRKLAAEHPGKLFIYAVDGDRHSLEETRTAQSLPEADILRAALTGENKCLVDMAPVFTAKYRADGRLFNFRDDYHWNAHGHRVVGETIAAAIKEHLPKL